MSIFNLPDLGEGLPDAEIHEWFVQIGDEVQLDQPLASMETAKAVVEVPSPQAGRIEKLFGQAGDIIKTGMPLVEFANVAVKNPDQGTVVGRLEEASTLGPDTFTIGSSSAQSGLRASPATRALARKLKVDLNLLSPNAAGLISREQVEAAAAAKHTVPEGYESLRGVRRAMLSSMRQSHSEVVPVSIFDQADIHRWPEDADITIRLIRAIENAAAAEPALNAWFDTESSARKNFEALNIGLAMDNEEGLFVPVIHDVARYSDTALRQEINNLKQQVSSRTVPSEKLKGATISLSNFGKFAGRYASPIIVPPCVAILAVGKLYQAVVAIDGQPKVHPVLPLSLSFDHRAITGGEATRFLGAMIAALEQH